MYGEGQGLGERQGSVVPRPELLQRLDDPENKRRDFAVAAASHPIPGISLDPGVLHVNTGTPVKPTRTGWVPCSPDELPIAYAGNHHMGGESFVAYRAITLEAYRKLFYPGVHYNIASINDYGQVEFTEQDQGPYVALSESQIVVDVSKWKPPPVAPEPLLARPADVGPIPRDQFEKIIEEHRADDEFELPGEYDDDEGEEGQQEEGQEGRGEVLE